MQNIPKLVLRLLWLHTRCGLTLPRAAMRVASMPALKAFLSNRFAPDSQAIALAGYEYCWNISTGVAAACSRLHRACHNMCTLYRVVSRPCPPAHRLILSRRMAAAIKPGNASGVQANEGTPNAASFPASARS